jgi:hypothetical protein
MQTNTQDEFSSKLQKFQDGCFGSAGYQVVRRFNNFLSFKV